jgi:outer membrane protein assembly factor BamD (BamD/ComL family)
MVQRPSGDSGVVPRLALIFALCGPLLLGIGWLVGGILGIVAVARGRSLMLSPNDRRTAWWSIVISLLWVAVLGGLVGFGTFRYVTEAVVKRNETQVANLLRGIALTQYYIKYSELLDADADGVSEYAWPAQLLSSGYHKVTVDLADHSVQHGYHVLIRNADEKSFLCTAVPVRYGLTGRRSYRIDEQGILVSGDVGGGDLPRSAGAALAYTQSQPVLNDVTEEFANDLAHAAEQAFEQGAYARCKRIIANVRSMFPQTEAAQRLTVLEATTDPFLLEFKSKELFQRARQLLDQDLVDPAIETLRTIVQEFPGASVAGQAKQLITESTVSRARENIEEAEQLLRDGQAEQALAVLQQTERRYPEAAVAASLKDRIAACQAEVMKMLEQDAQALLEEARACETEGKFEEAYNIYLTVQTRYGKTVAASSVSEALQKNRRMIEETEAARLIDDILELDPEQDAKRLLSLLDLLSRGYARTEKYKANQSLLDSLQRACQAHRYVTAARDYLKENSYRAALANLELAIKEDPNIALTMGDELEQCYLRLANASYESQNYADALQYYQNYLRLHPQDNLANHKRLMECSFQVAKARLQSGEYQEAEKLLLSCAELYGTDPEYNYVYGRVLARLGRWEDAAQRLASCFSVDAPFARDARVRWSYCQYRCAIDQEEALRRAIYDDDDYLKLVNDYGVTFDLAQRTNVLGGTPGALRATPGKSFADLAIEVCSQLDALAIEAEKLTHSSKGTTEQRLVQRTKIRAMILEMPNQLNILRASASADAYRKAKVLEQLGEVRRLYAALKLALGQINDQMRNPELIRLLNGLTAKLSALAKAEESFGLYNGLIEQRRRRVIAIVENLVSELNPTSANASVLKGRADAIRQLYATSKETDLAVQSLRAFAEAYAVLPPIAGLMLPEPATGIAAPAADTRAVAK